jgi:hypothetical protein
LLKLGDEVWFYDPFEEGKLSKLVVDTKEEGMVGGIVNPHDVPFYGEFYEDDEDLNMEVHDIILSQGDN